MGQVLPDIVSFNASLSACEKLQQWSQASEPAEYDVKYLPSGYVNSLLLKMACEIVDFPIKNGDFQ